MLDMIRFFVLSLTVAGVSQSHYEASKVTKHSLGCCGQCPFALLWCKRDWKKWEIQNAYLHKLYKHTFTLSIHNWSTVLNSVQCLPGLACGQTIFNNSSNRVLYPRTRLFSHSLENTHLSKLLTEQKPFSSVAFFAFFRHPDKWF